ncbi:MAG: hypothetical protein RBT74_06750 [Tenuifilaceae bacterium]|jgi:hypothetical protein|nr:hypothetical protein [Tenuifilaceae bacterium]
MTKRAKIQELRDLLRPFLKPLGFNSMKVYRVDEPIKDSDLFKCSDNGQILPYSEVKKITNPKPWVWKICGNGQSGKN